MLRIVDVNRISSYPLTRESYARWVIQNRHLTIFFSLLLVFSLGLGLKNWQTTGDQRVFFPPDDPYLIKYDDQQTEFSDRSNVFIAIEPSHGNVFDKNILTLVESFTARAWQIPYAVRVDSLSNFQVSQSIDDDLFVGPLYEDGKYLTDQDIEKIRVRVLNEKRLLSKLISKRADVTAINIKASLPSDQINDARFAMIDEIKQIIGEYKQDYPTVNFYLSGDIPIDQAFTDAPRIDARFVYPLGSILTVILLLFILKSFLAMMVSYTVVICSVLAGVGSVCWFNIELTPIITCAPVMILILGLADCIHIIVIYVQGMARGLSRADAMQESLVINFKPVVLTSVTTAISFYTLMISEVQPYKVLGFMVGNGVLFAMLMSLTLMPALASFLPIKARKSLTRFPKVDEFSNWLSRNTRLILLGFIVLVGLLMIGVSKNTTNDDTIAFFQPSMAIRTDSEFITKNLTGVLKIDVAVPAREPGGISEPRYLEVLDNFVDWLDTREGVAQADAYTDVIKELNKNMHGDELAFYKIPESRELASQYLLLYEMSLPMGLDLSHQVNMQQSQTLVSISLYSMTNNELIMLEEAIVEWFEQNAPAWMRPTVTSGDLMFAHITRKNTRTLIIGFASALAMISILLALMLKSVFIGIVSLITNSIPAIIAFGLWGFYSGYVSMGIATAFTMTLGLVVDDTIHFLSKFSHARKAGELPNAAIKYAFTTVGVAMVVTSVVLVSGFSTLVFSVFGPNSDAGLMSSVTIIFALLTVFLLLPALLLRSAAGRTS